MKPLLPAALLALPLAPPGRALDVCDRCQDGKLCAPHAELEAAEIARLRPQLESADPGERTSALRQVADLTARHENAPSAEVAAVLAAALEDPSLRVRTRAVQLLADGQHPETTVVSVCALLESFEANMWTLVAWLTGPDEQRGTVADAMKYLEVAMRASGDVPDDRVVEALSSVLLAMPAEMRGQTVAMAATRSLLELGTQDAVEAVLRQLSPWSETREMRNIHDALRDLAARLDVEAPEYGDDAGKQWKSWFRRNGRRLPKKLGRWRGAPVEDEVEDDGGGTASRGRR